MKESDIMNNLLIFFAGCMVGAALGVFIMSVLQINHDKRGDGEK